MPRVSRERAAKCPQGLERRDYFSKRDVHSSVAPFHRLMTAPFDDQGAGVQVPPSSQINLT